MLPVDQVIPFIRHEDPWVVDLAVRCLEWVRWPQRLTGDFVLDAVRDGHPELSHWLAHFEPSAAVLDYAVKALSDPQDDSEAYWYFAVIDRAPDELFTPDLARAIGKFSKALPKGFIEARLRLQTMELGTENIRDRFLRACENADNYGTAMSEHREIRLLADRLAYRRDVEWVWATLQPLIGSNTWAETWLFAILTKRRHHPTLSLALDRFATTNTDENESLTLELRDAVAELSGPEDLPRIVSMWNSFHPDNRSCLLEGICRLRFTEAEPVLLDFLRVEKDLTIRTIGAVGLCEMLSTRDESRQFIADMIEGEAFDVTYADLEQVAIPLGIIEGRPFPQEAEWRKRLGEEGSRDARRREIFRERHGDLAGVFDRLRAAFEDKQRTSSVRASHSAPVQELAQLSRAKTVGRNDPCPCGSGKKYKKCCLQKQ